MGDSVSNTSISDGDVDSRDCTGESLGIKMSAVSGYGASAQRRRRPDINDMITDRANIIEYVRQEYSQAAIL